MSKPQRACSCRVRGRGAMSARRLLTASALALAALCAGFLAPSSVATTEFTDQDNPASPAAYNRCVTLFGKPGGDPAGVYRAVTDSLAKTWVWGIDKGKLSSSDGAGTLSPVISWDPTSGYSYEDGVADE